MTDEYHRFLQFLILDLLKSEVGPSISLQISAGLSTPLHQQAANLGFFFTGPDDNLLKKSINLAKNMPSFYWPDQNFTGISPWASAKFAACTMVKLKLCCH